VDGEEENIEEEWVNSITDEVYLLTSFDALSLPPPATIYTANNKDERSWSGDGLYQRQERSASNQQCPRNSPCMQNSLTTPPKTETRPKMIQRRYINSVNML
jgi:hypothetical protein